MSNLEGPSVSWTVNLETGVVKEVKGVGKSRVSFTEEKVLLKRRKESDVRKRTRQGCQGETVERRSYMWCETENIRSNYKYRKRG